MKAITQEMAHRNLSIASQERHSQEGDTGCYSEGAERPRACRHSTAGMNSEVQPEGYSGLGYGRSDNDDTVAAGEK